MLGALRDGVWFVELAPLTEPGQVPVAVAAVLGLPDLGGPQPADTVVEALGCQDALIVLDNCEHLIDAAAKFCDTAIRHCPVIRFLATSREPLGIDGERVYRVPSMSLPSADIVSAADIADSDAVQLFAERARLSNPAFAIDDSTAPLVASICRRLDGIPLALELAAARLTSMSLQQVSPAAGPAVPAADRRQPQRHAPPANPAGHRRLVVRAAQRPGTADDDAVVGVRRRVRARCRRGRVHHRERRRPGTWPTCSAPWWIRAW